MITFITVWFLMAKEDIGYSSTSYTIPYSSKQSCLKAIDEWEKKSYSNNGYCWSGEMPVYVVKK